MTVVINADDLAWSEGVKFDDSKPDFIKVFEEGFFKDKPHLKNAFADVLAVLNAKPDGLDSLWWWFAISGHTGS